MQIAGIQKTTLVDYPGKVAATVFARGCYFRCGFCHNPELVLPEKYNPLIPEDEILSFLKTRVGKLEAVCITGGEPTIQPDILPFIRKVKELGFLVKLDTNGSRPDRLGEIISDRSVDYIAMDIKSPLDKYPLATGVKMARHSGLTLCHSERSEESHHLARHSGLPPRLAEGETGDPESSSTLMSFRAESRNLIQDLVKDPSASVGMTNEKLLDDIRQSIKMIMNSGIDYEFRTTVCHPLHEVSDFEEIGKLIKGAKRYYIQNFVESKQISRTEKYKPFTDEELTGAKNSASLLSVIEFR